jgi:ubiquinone/menaquinone biosynthesis C-methylase UbiE
LAFIERCTSSDVLSILDIGCGTGNQLVANGTAVPDATMVGVDRSLGMLRQAWPKSPDIAWVQADAAALPFPALSFDFVSCQFAFHHFQAKAGMLRELIGSCGPAAALSCATCARKNLRIGSIMNISPKLKSLICGIFGHPRPYLP